MTMAYEEFYVNHGQRTIGSMFEFAFYNLKMDLDDFTQLFIYSGFAMEFEKGNPKYVAGMSGVELAMRVVEQTTDRDIILGEESYSNRSRAYWAGWVLSYYQWYTGKSFERLVKLIPVKTILQLYEPLCQSDIKKIVAVLDKMTDGVVVVDLKKTKDGATNLAKLRKHSKLSQRGLADKSGVKIRMVQLYEQRQNDINKGQAMTIKKLSEALNCRMEDLLEK